MLRSLVAGCFGFFSRRSLNCIIMTAIAFTACLGYLDYRVGDRVAITFFYLLPVAFSAWFAGKKPGFLLSLLCSATWLYLNLHPTSGASPAFQQFWNGLTTLGFFSVVVLLVSGLNEALVHTRVLSHTDYLTGILNGRGFNEIVSHEIRRHRRNGQALTMAYVDLDNFKQINDAFGHDVGDELLMTVAATMSSTLRSTDLVARVGGDEFAILLPETDMAAANTAIAKLQKNLRQIMTEKGWGVTSSIGVLTCEVPIQNPNDMLSLADKLMYAVKKAGKNALRHAVYKGQMSAGAPTLVTVGA